MSSIVGWDGDLSYSSEGEVRDGSDKCIPDGSKYTRGKPEIYRMICLLSEGLFGLPLARDGLEDEVTNFSALMHHIT